ncbi:zinc finger protein 665-like isoform X1 [Schistocerca serialis cubense]|uniref:zinc finger protein 665-like isoform X1 n=2 Tax=Schistocerca TaxID=7008 RepID=UPI00214EC3D3|nr:zinc finger protein 665-like isoform X1 [Schistocerca serialis cubense]
MDHQKTIRIKDETNETAGSPGSIVQVYHSSVKIKEEWQETGNQELLQDPLKIEDPCYDIKEEPGLKLNERLSEHNIFSDPKYDPLGVKTEEGSAFENDCLDEYDPLSITDDACLEDNLGISHPNDFIKEDPELNLEVAASIRNASDSLRFIQSAGDSCDISYQETLHQGVVNDKLEIYAEKSTDFSVSHNYTKIQTSQEDGLCGTRLSCSTRGKEFHKFNCSFCLQSFPSKYRLIMHIFIHIDGVQAPAFVCKSCGEVLPSDDCLKEHLRMMEGDQALSATNSEKLECSDDHENNISFDCVQEGIMEQTAGPPSYKVPRKTFKKSFNDICNTHTVKQAEEKLERCNDCGISCTSDHAHVHTVLSAKGHHKCDVCGKMFTVLGNLKKHRLIHTGERPHECNVCGKSFAVMSYLKKHEIIHTGQRPHKCNVCGKSFAVMSYLKKHEIIHTGQRPHKCGVCGKSFTHSSSLKSHILRHTGKRPHKCDVCAKSFTERCNLKQHELIHTGQRPYKCDVCGKSFTQSGRLKNHNVIHTGKRQHKRQHKCDVCAKSFTERCNLKKHELIHTGQRPHKCDVCGKSFTQSGHLKTHELIHTGRRPHSCNVCGKSFTQSSSLKTHELIHTGHRHHKCDTCGKLFNALSNRKAQKIIHSGKRPYKCSICGKSFIHWGSLKTHELIHTGQRPHKCDVCGKSFAQSGNLKTHVLIHTGRRPHSCNACGKSFTQLVSLKTHLLIHTAKRPHKCDVCGKSSTRSGYLNSDVLIHT